MSPRSTLADVLDSSAGKAKLAGIVDDLVAVSEAYELNDIRERLRTIRDDLDAESLAVAFLGSFSAGKSTLLNALLGETTAPVPAFGRLGPLHTGDLPGTAVLTLVRYAEQPRVVAHHHDGSSSTWEVDRWLTASDPSADEAENHRRFGQVQSIEVGYPARLCAAGLTLLDTPGLDGLSARATITRAALHRCDAAVLVTRSDVVPSQRELDLLHDLTAANIGVFVVVNAIDGTESDAPLRRYLSRLLTTEAAHQVYVVNAAEAMAAKSEQDAVATESSGIAAFERGLGRFLVDERVRIRLSRFATFSDRTASEIQDSLTARRLALRDDPAELTNQRDRAEQLLADLRDPKRDRRLHQLFTTYERQAGDALAASLQEMVGAIRVDLPQHLNRTELPAERAVFGATVLQRRLLQETAEEISRFAGERIERWGATVAQEIIEVHLDELGTQVEAEVAGLAGTLTELRGSLGADLPDGSPSLVRPLDRVAGSIAGTLLADVRLDRPGGGLKMAISASSGVAAAQVALSAVGVGASLFFPILLLAPIAIGIGIVAGRGLGRRIKAQAYLRADEQLAALPAAMTPVIRERIGDQFEQLQKSVSAAVQDLVEEEAALYTSVLDLSRRQEYERRDYEARIGAALDRVADCRARLNNLLTAPRAIGAEAR